ncbi:hypothetical protein ACJX0J_016394, partial [Zea mays]
MCSLQWADPANFTTQGAIDSHTLLTLLCQKLDWLVHTTPMKNLTNHFPQAQENNYAAVSAIQIVNLSLSTISDTFPFFWIFSYRAQSRTE